MKEKPVLFILSDGTKVHHGDILFHPNRRTVGWYCIAEFQSPRNYSVTVRSPNGAVPRVLVADLRKSPPPLPERCGTCGQLLPGQDEFWLKKHYKVNAEIDGG